jgi:hypothetical protein
MHHSRLRLGVFAFFVLLALSACFEYDSVIHINADGSGRAEFAYRFPPGLLDRSDLGGKIPQSQKDVDARYRMRAGVTQYHAEFRDLPKFKEVRIDVAFDNIASLSERGSTYSYDIEGGYKVFRLRLDKSSSGVQGGPKNQFQAEMTRKVLDRYKITFKVYLPEKIDQSNAQLVEWNAATWSIPISAFLSNEKNTIVLEAKSKVSLWERVKWQVGKLFS